MSPAIAQKQTYFSRADTLRGSLSPLRSCYDVFYYDLSVSIYPGDRFIKGHNAIHFQVLEASDQLQLDLFANMQIDSILYNHHTLLPYTREFGAVFVRFPDTLNVGSTAEIKVYYQGKPLIASNAPWDGGFVWKKDDKGRPFVGVACEGTGASLWWPCKDHLSDEPDSMRISVECDNSLFAKSNGQLKGSESLTNNRMRYHWKVSYPINNYNVTVNLAHYVHFNDVYIAKDGDSLALDYYVIDYNLEVAKKQFEQVKPMLKCYEEYFGKYPFWKDGYALVESPYLGMEHQGAVAYGNKFMNGYMGFDRSRTGWGSSWDYIIIHETGHEYWGNAVSTKDHAELWIHESFCTYSEGLYVECRFGKEAGIAYLNGLKRNVSNSSPIIAPLGVNASGSGDMYDKGALMLNSVRHSLENDSLWFALLRGLVDHFSYKTTTTDSVLAYMAAFTGNPDIIPMMRHYLYQSKLPMLEYRMALQKKNNRLEYRWVSEEKGFTMPVPFIDKKGDTFYMRGTTQWKALYPNKRMKKLFPPTFDKNALYFEAYPVENRVSFPAP